MFAGLVYADGRLECPGVSARNQRGLKREHNVRSSCVTRGVPNADSEEFRLVCDDGRR